MRGGEREGIPGSLSIKGLRRPTGVSTASQLPCFPRNRGGRVQLKKLPWITSRQACTLKQTPWKGSFSKPYPIRKGPMYSINGS